MVDPSPRLRIMVQACSRATDSQETGGLVREAVSTQAGREGDSKANSKPPGQGFVLQ